MAVNFSNTMSVGPLTPARSIQYPGSPATVSTSSLSPFATVNSWSPNRTLTASPAGSIIDRTWRSGPNPASPTTTRVTVTPFEATDLASPRSQAIFALTSPIKLSPARSPNATRINASASLPNSVATTPVGSIRNSLEGSPAILPVGSAGSAGSVGSAGSMGSTKPAFSTIQPGFFSPASNWTSQDRSQPADSSAVDTTVTDSNQAPVAAEVAADTTLDTMASPQSSIMSDTSTSSSDSITVSGSLLAELLKDPKYADSIMQLARDNGLSQAQIDKLRDFTVEADTTDSTTQPISPEEPELRDLPMLPSRSRGRTVFSPMSVPMTSPMSSSMVSPVTPATASTAYSLNINGTPNYPSPSYYSSVASSFV